MRRSLEGKPNFQTYYSRYQIANALISKCLCIFGGCSGFDSDIKEVYRSYRIEGCVRWPVLLWILQLNIEQIIVCDFEVYSRGISLLMSFMRIYLRIMQKFCQSAFEMSGVLDRGFVVTYRWRFLRKHVLACDLIKRDCRLWFCWCFCHQRMVEDNC